MARTKTHKIANLTPEIVIEHSKLKIVRGERPLKKHRCTFLTNLIKTGELVSSSFGEAFCEETNETYGVNGRHSTLALHACHTKNNSLEIRQLCGLKPGEAWPDFPTNIECIIDTWKIDKLTELIGVFDVYDNPNAARSTMDKLGVFKGEHPDLEHIENRFLGQIIAGIAPVVAEHAMQEKVLLGATFTMFNMPSSRNRGIFFSFKGLRNYIKFVVEHVVDADLISRCNESKFVFQQYIKDGPETTKEILNKIFTQDDQEEGPGYELMTDIRHWIAKGRKKVNQSSRRAKLATLWDNVQKDVISS